jgi:NADH/F420H2 dehydrogenase subunit C
MDSNRIHVDSTRVVVWWTGNKDREMEHRIHVRTSRNRGVVGVQNHQETTRIVPADRLPTVMRILRDHTGFQFERLTDVVGVDYPNRERRFDVVYNRLSLRYARRVTVKVRTHERAPVPSRTGRFTVANWMEREVWDRFGVGFEGHPDRRRLLTDYGFEGHPMRKDFPLTGYTEVRYDEEAKRVVSEPVERSQEYRYVHYTGGWDARPGTTVKAEKVGR